MQFVIHTFPYAGTNSFYGAYAPNDYDSYYYEKEEEVAYQHYMPSIEAVRGYNMMNVAHYNKTTDTRTNFFENPV